MVFPKDAASAAATPGIRQRLFSSTVRGAANIVQYRLKFRAASLLAVMAISLLCVTVAAGKDVVQMIFHMRRPPAGADVGVEQLAEQIDWLEKHIDSYGSVVAKQPDVWGQARLTKHRQEYEHEMYQQLNKFDVYLQGAISQSDQAFLANALTLNAAASSPAGQPSSTKKLLRGHSGPALNLQMASSTPAFGAGPAGAPSNGGQASAASLLATPDQFFQPMQPFPFQNFALSPSQSSNRIGIEPTIALDQRSTYLDHLHEIRRRNEGDDTADSPGYGLYLVRVPISVMPGKRTYHGYAAEITITAHPHLTPSLLEVTFRNLVVNDVVDQLSLPVTRIADEIAMGTSGAESSRLQPLRLRQAFLRGQIAQTEKQKRNVERQLGQMITIVSKNPGTRDDLQIESDTNDAFRRLTQGAEFLLPMLHQLVRELSELNRELDLTTATISSIVEHADRWSTAIHGPASRLRQARNAIPATQVEAVFGAAELYFVAKKFNEAYTGPNVRWNDDPRNKHVMYLDVQGFLEDGIQAAYQLLAERKATGLWNDPGFSPNDIAEAIRAGRMYEVCRMRENFYRAIRHTSVRELLEAETRGDEANNCQEDVVKALAWPILVESSLLNAHLIGDMKTVSKTKPDLPPPPEGLQFFRPEPDPLAREVFNQYVAARWPIHVFALDPYAWEQNIANDFQRRRELQIALSLGFAQGQISANEMMNYARRVETEIQTVTLNKTIVGFSYGDDTFGWRFYPRLQPPPIKGNLQTFVDNLFGPSTRCDNLEQKLEPGIRECVALVIMPSFVPYITLETRSSWFRLNAHSGWLPTRHKREMSMVDSMKLSRSIRAMHEMSAQLCDAQAYRPGDLRLMMTRVHQLDRQLPMQAMLVQVPIENTIGGFQMFNNGITDLAPELHGWYGAPGIIISKAPPAPACHGCSSCNGNQGNGVAHQRQTSAATQFGTVGGASGNGPVHDTMPSGGGTGSAAATTLADDAAKLADNTVKLAAEVVSLTSSSLKTITDAATQPRQPSTRVPLPPDCECSGTTVFLVGNHFTTVDTRVIAGGVCIPRDAVTLLSRQVMQVTIPWNAHTVTLDGSPWVDVHVATPYGVTGHLHIPVYYADRGSSDSKTLAEMATAMSPLEVVLNDEQQLPVDDAPPFNFAGDPTDRIKLHCLDPDVCQALDGEYSVYGFVYNKTDYVGKTSLDGATIQTRKDNRERNGTLSFPASELYRAVEGVLRQNQQKVSDGLAKGTLVVQLYLKQQNLPSLHVIGPLPIVARSIAARQPPVGAPAPNPAPAGAERASSANRRAHAHAPISGPADAARGLRTPNDTLYDPRGADRGRPDRRRGPTLAPPARTSSLERLPRVRYAGETDKFNKSGQPVLQADAPARFGNPNRPR